MSNKGQLLQDPFLNALRREHVPVSIYLVNGIKLQGQIESFDQYVVLLRNTVTQMVYKHAISTIVPGRAVNFNVADNNDNEARPLETVDSSFPRAAARGWGGLDMSASSSSSPDATPVVLVGVDFGLPHFDAELEELGLLAQTAGLDPVARITCKRKTPDAALFVGSGKAEEIRMLAQMHGAQEVLFDQALSPAQQRNLENTCRCRSMTVLC